MKKGTIIELGKSKITRSWQITLPKMVRKILRVSKGDYIIFFKEGKKIYMIPAEIRPRVIK